MRNQAFSRALQQPGNATFIVTAAGLLLAALLAAAWALWVIHALPPLADLGGPRPPAVQFLTREGQPFARRGALRAAPVEVKALSPDVVQPFISIEDRRFYQHHGVDLRGALRAAAANARAGHIVEGGSTITQQLVKNTMLSPEQTLGRKAKEAVGALWLEHRMSKTEILSRYLNTVYFGEGAYGLEAAAQTYFGKPANELSASEASMLAGLVKAPSQLAPTRHPAAAIARQRQVLAALVRDGHLTPSAAAKMVPPAVRAQASEASYGGYFADWVYPQLKAHLQPAYGEVSVRTTLDGELQQRAEQVVDTALRAGNRGVSQAALVAIRRDGSIAAMVGGRDYGSSPFNRATQARRQPGSAFKLFAYLAAFRSGASPETLVSDGPIKIGNWSPTNADKENHGDLTLEEAFARSSNLAAIRVAQAVGLPAVVEAARDLGVKSPLTAVPSLPLGTSGVTLLELTSAYAGVARGSYPVVPVGFEDQGQPPQSQMDWDREQRPLLQILQAAAEGGTGRAAALAIPVFGKTGTSQNYRDAVFVGFAGDLTVGVWVGNDDETPMKGMAGGAMPAQIWRAFMETALQGDIAATQTQPAFSPDDLPNIDAAPEEDRTPWFDQPRSVGGA